MQQHSTQPQTGRAATGKPGQISGFRKPLQQTAFGSRPSPVHHRRGMARCCLMLALLPLPVPLPANPPRRLPVMRDFWQRWTNLVPPPASNHKTPQSLATHSGPFRQPHGHEARTNLGPLATSPTDARRPPQRLATRSGHGDNLLPRRPDTPRATAIFTSRRSRGSLPTSIIFRPRR